MAELFDEPLPVTLTMRRYREPELFRHALPVYFPEGMPGGGSSEPGTGKNAITGWFHAKGYGVKCDGTDDSAALSSVIAAAASAGGGEVYLEGAATIFSSVALKSKVTLRGPAATRGKIAKVVANSTVTTALLIGASADQVSEWHMRDIGLDGSWGTNNTGLNGIQITNGESPLIEFCDFQNFGGSSILLSGLNTLGGTPNARILDNTLTNIGMSNGSTGFGVNLRGSSHYASIERNVLKNIVGGMGIGGAGDSTIGYPTGCTVSNNWIWMATSTIGFEPIGITAGCDRWTISANHLYNSQDNGISVSSSWNNCFGNYIDSAFNSGIAISGNYNQVYNNTIKNAGKQVDATYGMISLYNSASRNSITENIGIDDQTTHTATFGIKGVLSGGFNWIVGNTFTGLLGALTTGLLTTDTFVDRDTNSGVFQTSQARFTMIKGPDDNTALQFGNSTRLTGMNFSGSSTIGAAQFNLGTNVPATRPNGSCVAVFGQAANMFEFSTSTAGNVLTVVGRVTKTGRIASSDGITTKDLGDITGKTSAQIDALFLAAPEDGTIATGLLSTNPVFLSRRNGKWNYTSATVIA